MAIICQHCVSCFNVVLRVYQLDENGRTCMSKITNIVIYSIVYSIQTVFKKNFKYILLFNN